MNDSTTNPRRRVQFVFAFSVVDPKEFVMANKSQEILDRAGPGKLQNPLAYINDYNDEMSIAQVVRFFEKQDIHITKTMIQNYVKMGLLPPPKNKRYYVKAHFILITILMQIKDILPLDAMTEIFRPLWEDHSDNLKYIYDAYLRMQEDACNEAAKTVPAVVKAAEDENSQCFAVIVLLGFLSRILAAKKTAVSAMEILKQI